MREAIIELLVAIAGPSELDEEYHYYLSTASDEELVRIINTYKEHRVWEDQQN